MNNPLYAQAQSVLLPELLMRTGCKAIDEYVNAVNVNFCICMLATR
jgi:hypothetical protein